MIDININTNVNNALTSNYNQKNDIQRNVAVGVNPESASTFNTSVMSGSSAVRPVNNNESKPNNPQTTEKERANINSNNNNFSQKTTENEKTNNNNDNNNVSQKSIQLEFDKATGYPVIKFRDTKGNVVSQVPPEQFLKMRSVLGYNSRKEEIVDNNESLYSRKVGEEMKNQNSSETNKDSSGSSKENNLSLYI